MNLRIVSAVAVSLVAAATIPAHAQLVGTYNGTQANGQAISLTVVQGKKNAVDLSGLGLNIETTCPDKQAINQGDGIGFQPVPIPNPKFTFDLLANPELYIASTMLFDDATQSVKGTITAYVPALDTFTKKPKKSETCISKQTFTAKIGAPQTFHPGQPRTIIY